jgi:hypothetical protein
MPTVADDNYDRASCARSFLMVTGPDVLYAHTMSCLTQQLHNTLHMQSSPRDRIAKRQRNAKGPYTQGMIKAEKHDKKNLEFFIEHVNMLGCFITELEAKPELDRQKCVAFAMGHQKRLGATSYIANFDPELVRMILEGV